MPNRTPHKEQAGVHEQEAERLLAKLASMMGQSGVLVTRLQYEHELRLANLHALLHIGERLDDVISVLAVHA